MTSFHGNDQLDEFLSHSRLLINLLPDTPQTRGILNQSLFSKLPQSSYLINLARGSHLVDNDLLEAIDDGQIAGASLMCSPPNRCRKCTRSGPTRGWMSRRTLLHLPFRQRQ